MTYKPGDIANGHVLGTDNVWRPLPTPPPATAMAAPDVAGGPLTVKGHTGTVVLEPNFVVIVRSGLLARASVGKGQKRIP